ncbi:hypothetical protein ABZ871_40540 [Streptomyces populi]
MWNGFPILPKSLLARFGPLLAAVRCLRPPGCPARVPPSTWYR